MVMTLRRWEEWVSFKAGGQGGREGKVWMWLMGVATWSYANHPLNGTSHAVPLPVWPESFMVGS